MKQGQNTHTVYWQPEGEPRLHGDTAHRFCSRDVTGEQLRAYFEKFCLGGISSSEIQENPP